MPTITTDTRKMRIVLVKCLWVDTDGVTPVDMHGNICPGDPKKYCYSWEPQRRGERWLKANPKLWKPLAEPSA